MIYTLMSIYLFAHATTSAGDNVASVLQRLISAINTWKLQCSAPKPCVTVCECVCVCVCVCLSHLVQASSLALCPDRCEVSGELKDVSQR